VGVSPIERFRAAYERALLSEPEYPDAAVLATVGPDGRPSARVVLVRYADERGFTFFTNYLSHKGRELDGQKVAALCFHWKTTHEQVRVEGRVARVPEAESDTYFAGRPRESQLGAHASLQSEPLASREALEQRVAEVTARFDGGPVPRPSHWGGYRLVPDRLELWSEGAFRLHDRLVFERDAEGPWRERRLFP
jgi:pyridoxamine 5'-phosphate oxidase